MTCAEYLSSASTSIPAVPGKQNVTTYTIGFTVDLPILRRHGSPNGGGEYYSSPTDVQVADERH